MILHTDMFVRSIDKSLDFYVGCLGFEVVEDTIVSGGLVKYVSNGKYSKYRLVLLKVAFGSAMIELLEYLDTNETVSEDMLSKSNITILVDSIDMKIEELKRMSLMPISEVFTVHTPKFGESKIVFFKDPDGNEIEFLEMLK